MFIKEEADEHEDAKAGNPASSSGSDDTDKQVNRDFIFYIIIYFIKLMYIQANSFRHLEKVAKYL